VLFITHDLALANSICDRVCVMYAGRLVEVREGHRIFDDPRHPYTMGLLARVRAFEADSLDSGDRGHADERDGGARWLLVSPRCVYAIEECRQGRAGTCPGPGRRRALCPCGGGTPGAASRRPCGRTGSPHPGRRRRNDMLLEAENLSKTFRLRSGLLGRATKLVASAT